MSGVRRVRRCPADSAARLYKRTPVHYFSLSILHRVSITNTFTRFSLYKLVTEKVRVREKSEGRSDLSQRLYRPLYSKIC
ncbi:unnamed protein product [Oikopleura dioica]|uniref:Uncharacterized protein n=1 Tax=Oikopleura dioica TaxID=34765 RepID=E4Y7V8_OIKDI|nr:unnamed protein product [Oikopleura dioica]